MAAEEPTLQYLTTTRIGEKGQLTVPKQFRDELGLGTGAPFAVLRIGNGLILLPEQERFNSLCDQINQILTSSGIQPESIVATLPASRARVFRRFYGNARPPRARGKR